MRKLIKQIISIANYNFQKASFTNKYKNRSMSTLILNLCESCIHT